MMWTGVLLAVVGLALSALFSGAETGFYRATRLRLRLDSLGGDRIAAGLFWLIEHPSWFVSTTLAGTNVANYLVSLGVVILADALAGAGNSLLSLAANILVVPVLFVYGDLLPKSLFLQAPNRLLRLCGPVLLACVALFAPFSIVFAVLGRLVTFWRSKPPEPLSITLARRELQRVLEEGHQVGILHPAQRALAQGIFAAGGRDVTQFLLPAHAVPCVPRGIDKQEALRVAAAAGSPLLCVVEPQEPSQLVGYTQVIELAVAPEVSLVRYRALREIDAQTPHLAALVRLETSKDPLAVVVDAKRRPLGLVSLQSLRGPLLPPRG